MRLATALHRLRSRWWVVLTYAVALALLAFAGRVALPDRSTATTTLYVTATGAQDATSLSMGTTFVQNQIRSYPALVSSPVILDEAARQLGDGTTTRDLATSIEAAVPLNTTVLTVSATGADPQVALNRSRVVAQTFARRVVELERRPRAEFSPVRLQVVGPPEVQDSAVMISAPVAAALGALLGVMIGLVLAVLPALRGARDD